MSQDFLSLDEVNCVLLGIEKAKNEASNANPTYEELFEYKKNAEARIAMLNRQIELIQEERPDIEVLNILIKSAKESRPKQFKHLQGYVSEKELQLMLDARQWPL